jgi:small subunit ribosomal protein S5
MADETNDTQNRPESQEVNREQAGAPAPESPSADEPSSAQAQSAAEAGSPPDTGRIQEEGQIQEAAETQAAEAPAVETPAVEAPAAETPAVETRVAVTRPAARKAHKPRSSGRASRAVASESPAAAPEGGEIEESVVKIYRCAAVVKGGRRFSFAALVVAGDRNGRVGLGYGKANEVPNAVEKANKAARRNMRRIRLEGTTIPHQVRGHFGASKVEMIPAVEGTGVIAGASVRAVLELAGVKDARTKCHGSTSPKNLVKAAFDGLTRLRSKEDIEKLREVSLA